MHFISYYLNRTIREAKRFETGSTYGKGLKSGPVLGRIQDLVKGGLDKLPPRLSNCYCCSTSPFFTRKSMVKIFAFVSL